MRSRIVAAGIVLACLASAAPVLAWPHFDVTESEVLSVDPPRVRTTFTILESGPTQPGGCGYAYISVAPLDPQSPDAPQIFDCSTSPRWTCSLGTVPPGVPGVWFDRGGSGSDPNPYDTFSIVTDRAEPCVRVVYYCVVLLGSPPPPIEACLAVDMPVPVGASTWGRMKSRYR